MKYYAVRVGKEPGIYRSWEDCKNQVHGFKGAEYKSFKTEEEALSYMGLGSSVSPDLDHMDPGQMVAYVDGSFNKQTETYGYGLVLFTQDGKEEYKGAKQGDYASHRNVAGEVLGAVRAMEMAMDRGFDQLIIHYDYAGIRHWALGEWKANTEMTQSYQAFAKKVQSRIKLDFIKVEAHSGDVYNDEADRLAKEACGIKQ